MPVPVFMPAILPVEGIFLNNSITAEEMGGKSMNFEKKKDTFWDGGNQID